MASSYTAATAAVRMAEKRERIDAACKSGALFAVDVSKKPDVRHAWRIEEDDLIDWHRRGRPLTIPA